VKQGTPIAVVGSVNSDYSVFMKKLPRPGETVLAHEQNRFAGGKGLNQAVAAARGGGNVLFRFSVGEDEDGEFLAGFLEKESMVCVPLIDQERSTSKAFILVDENGENQISVIPGANYSSKLSDISFDEGPGFLVLQLEIGSLNNLTVAKKAKLAGWKTVLTPAPSSQFSPELLEFIDVLTLNEVEAIEIAGASDFLSSGEALSRQVSSVFLTRGSSGVAVFQDGSLMGIVDALKVNSVDATGAGDTFCGYLVAGLSQGMDPISAAKLATIAAGISVQTRGASNSIPYRVEVDSLLSKT